MAKATGRLGQLMKETMVGEDESLIITKRLRQYLMSMPSIKANIPTLTSILEDDSNSVRHGRFGASSRGTCLRRQLFAFENMAKTMEYNPQLALIFQDGTWRHLRWQMMGLDAGIFTHVEVPYASPEYRLTVSVDAVNDEEGWLFELKGSRTMFSEPPMPHLLQIHTYFLATGMQRAVYVVEHKATQEWREWVIDVDPALYKVVLDELRELNHAVDERKLPPVLDECKSKKGCFKDCPYATKCLDQVEYPADGKWSDD